MQYKRDIGAIVVLELIHMHVNLTHSLTQSLALSHTHSLTHSLSLSRSLTHSLTLSHTTPIPQNLLTDPTYTYPKSDVCMPFIQVDRPLFVERLFRHRRDPRPEIPSGSNIECRELLRELRSKKQK